MTRVMLSFSVSTLALVLGLLTVCVENANRDGEGRLDRLVRERWRTEEENRAMREQIERLEHAWDRIESRLVVEQN